MNTTLEIVEALEQRAKLVGLSMATVCGRASVAQSTVTRWKSGEYEPRLRVLKRLDDVLATAEREKLAAQPAPPSVDRVLSAQA